MSSIFLPIDQVCDLRITFPIAQVRQCPRLSGCEINSRLTSHRSKTLSQSCPETGIDLLDVHPTWMDKKVCSAKLIKDIALQGKFFSLWISKCLISASLFHSLYPIPQTRSKLSGFGQCTKRIRLGGLRELATVLLRLFKQEWRFFHVSFSETLVFDSQIRLRSRPQSQRPPDRNVTTYPRPTGT